MLWQCLFLLIDGPCQGPRRTSSDLGICTADYWTWVRLIPSLSSLLKGYTVKIQTLLLPPRLPFTLHCKTHLSISSSSFKRTPDFIIFFWSSYIAFIILRIIRIAVLKKKATEGLVHWNVEVLWSCASSKAIFSWKLLKWVIFNVLFLSILFCHYVLT